MSRTPGDGGERRELAKRERARDIGLGIGVALPDAADPKPAGADLLGPARNALRLGER